MMTGVLVEEKARAKVPLSSVVVPCCEPFTLTETPESGVPLSSTTFPVILKGGGGKYFALAVKQKVRRKTDVSFNIVRFLTLNVFLNSRRFKLVKKIILLCLVFK
jgi:hypothetical protein